MELRQLEAFATVARRASFTRAAEELHLTQPAVTRQIAALEGELGTLLFDRLGKRVTLTEAGNLLLPHAEALLRRTQEAKKAIAALKTGQRGQLRIAAASTLAAYILPPVLMRFRAAFPEIELILRTGLSARVRELVSAGQADVGFVTTEGEEPAIDPQLEVRPLGGYETCLVVPLSHPLATQRCVTAAALASEPLLAMEPGTSLRTYTERLLSALGIAATPTLELDSVETIKRLVEAGLGVALLPRAAVEQEEAVGRLRAITLPPTPIPSRGIALICHRQRTRFPALQAFLALAAGDGS